MNCYESLECVLHKKNHWNSCDNFCMFKPKKVFELI